MDSPKTPTKQGAFGGQSSDSSPASSDAATFAHKEDPSHLRNVTGIDSTNNDPTQSPEYFHYAEHGAPIDNRGPQHEAAEAEFQLQKGLLWSRIRHQIRDPLAEFLGCFTLIIFGDGSVAQVLLSSNPNLPKGDQNKGAYQSISWGYDRTSTGNIAAW